jgi:hypothetical protein
MRQLLRHFRNQTADTEFKCVAGGWIFRAPIPWYFGRRPHYFADETQKTQVEEILVASQRVAWLLLLPLFLVVFLGLPLVLPNITSNSNDHLPLILIVFFLFGLLINFLQNLYNCFALRPSLRLLPRAAEKITLADRLRTRALYFSVKRLILLVLLSLFLLFVVAYLTLTKSVYWSALALVIVWTGVHTVAMLWTKLGTAARPSPWQE